LFSLPCVLVDNKVAGSYFNAKCLNSKTHSYLFIEIICGKASVFKVLAGILIGLGGYMFYQNFGEKNQLG